MEVPVTGKDVSKDKVVMYFQGKSYELPNDRLGYEDIFTSRLRVVKWIY
ncbi:hypothetical protein J5U23_00322 [Saccharolobus shibatae B12]|uniref:Uncharacterized protein n=1 Tax=Saccharolobus shibatae (strain ATCC 51178 / DSM 5389 / JCM 8931 / NBRC 15437 / B12) TaxID=523848 RepID=A0A8F5BLF0_SACSH|nr:hypothetical protein J5U23_00322 [Saccharolobus shibatae B12]